MKIEKIKQYCYLARLNKPIGSLLLLWPTFWGLWLAGAGQPNKFIVLIFIAGVLVMRSAGCVLNDFADRKFDGKVARTRFRPLVTGKIKPREALIFFLILLLTAFLLVLQLNFFTILLAIAGALLTLIYPFMKRFTYLPQIGLGVAFSWGVPMAFAAENNIIFAKDWLVFLAAVIWPVIYDTFYAMVDRADDIKIGVKSTAILFGERDKWWIGFLQMTFILLLGWIGYLFHLKHIYFFTLSLAGALFIYQQFLISNNDPQKCFRAFSNNQWLGGIIFLGIVLSYENCSG